MNRLIKRIMNSAFARNRCSASEGGIAEVSISPTVALPIPNCWRDKPDRPKLSEFLQWPPAGRAAAHRPKLFSRLPRTHQRQFLPERAAVKNRWRLDRQAASQCGQATSFLPCRTLGGNAGSHLIPPSLRSGFKPTTKPAAQRPVLEAAPDHVQCARFHSLRWLALSLGRGNETALQSRRRPS